MPPETAVAVREEQHPIITKIDEKMPEIAAMLPQGMDTDRFRRVAVQALVRNPELWECTPVSVVSAIVEAAQLGLEPTGVLGRAWLLPYRNKGQKEAKLIPGYRGYAELAWRADKIILKAEAVRAGDEFSYSVGMGADHFLRHVPNLDDPDREASDDNITFVYAVYTLADGRQDFAVMSRKAVEKVRARARYDNPVWASDFGEMAKKTVLRRLLKITPLSPQVAEVLGRDEAVDFDTPVARVADDRAAATRDRIAQRTEAIRAGRQDEAPVNDVWFREIHGKASKRGIDHERLSAWAKKKFGVESMKELTPSQRADMTLAVEAQPLIEQVGQGSGPAEPQESTPSGDQGSGETVMESRPTPPAAADTPEADAPPSSASGDFMQQVLETTGGTEIVDPPRPGSAAYKALPSGVERAAAADYWRKREPRGARETHEAAEVPA